MASRLYTSRHTLSDGYRRRASELARKGVRISTLTEKHRRLLRIMHPTIGHRFLPKHFILKHFDTNGDNLSHELRDLMRAPNQYIYWPQQQNYTLNAGYKHGVYALTHKGAAIVGMPLPKIRRVENEEGGGLYAHDLNASMFECDMKFGARAAGFTFEMGRPQRYKLPSSDWDPDCHPIAIGGKALFMPGVELERRPKGGSPADTVAKLDKIIEFMAVRYYETLGYTNALIPLVSTTEGRTKELMDLVSEKLNGSCPYMLFKTIPDWARERHFPNPNGAMFNVPFRRVGYPPLSLKQQLKGEVDMSILALLKRVRKEWITDKYEDMPDYSEVFEHLGFTEEDDPLDVREAIDLEIDALEFEAPDVGGGDAVQ